MNWCLDYWYLKNQFIYEFRADSEEIFQNESNKVSKLSSLIHKNKLKQNLFHLLLSVLAYTVYLYCIRKLSRCFFFFLYSWNNLNKTWTEELVRNVPVFCKKYLCSCNACLQFGFKECSGNDVAVYAELPWNNWFVDDEEVDAINKTE